MPVTCGVPLSSGLQVDPSSLTGRIVLADDTVPCQLHAQRGERWLLATFLCPPREATSERLVLHLDEGQPISSPIPIRPTTRGFEVDTETATFEVGCSASQLFAGPAWSSELHLITRSARLRAFQWNGAEIAEAGAVRLTIVLHGKCGPLRAVCQLSFYRGTNLVRCELTVRNPRRARHSGGYWDLGDPGSILFRGLSLDVALAGPVRQIRWRETLDGPEQLTDSSLSIHQESSGGENWRSPNHVDRNGKVALRYRGYRVRTAEGEAQGLRASPIVAVQTKGSQLACGIEEFWQKFPTGIEVVPSQLRLKLFPDDSPGLHELQAGETCTRTIWFDLSGSCEQLAWIHQPPTAVVEHQWLANTAGVRWTPLPQAELRQEARTLLQEALEGSNNFVAKREVIDEFGWRNFGDMWADHEAAYADDPSPVVSHYNNQYDLLHGLLIQYLLTADRRWWDLADPLARHVMDIDIYHTTRDKPAYNGGLFWHTAHYHAVGLATHRSMSTTMRGKKIPAPGAGPCNEHNYSDGLLLYHRLSGCPRAGECVLQLADWVIAMDDGERHLLGLFSGEPTGLASCTRDPAYHGPGRGAGNSINVLLNGWQLSGEDKYLEKCIDLIQRTIHPEDDLAALDLGNAELRWSYTVYLQALARFCEETAGQPRTSAIRDYARAALLHYARWMCEHETFYLDRPEQLEYPTETWAAQELRKGTTLLLAAQHISGPEAEAFRIRGSAILDRAWESLIRFESRTCTRPLAIVLQQCYLEAYLRSVPATELAFEPANSHFAARSAFRPQKQSIRRSLKQPLSLLRVLPRAMQPQRLWRALKQTWLAEKLRHFAEAAS
jgi:hypothetical protein